MYNTGYTRWPPGLHNVLPEPWKTRCRAQTTWVTSQSVAALPGLCRETAPKHNYKRDPNAVPHRLQAMGAPLSPYARHSGPGARQSQCPHNEAAALRATSNTLDTPPCGGPRRPGRAQPTCQCAQGTRRTLNTQPWACNVWNKQALAVTHKPRCATRTRRKTSCNRRWWARNVHNAYWRGRRCSKATAG